MACLLVVVAGCTPATDRRPPPDRDRIRLNLPGPPTTFDPALATTPSSRFLVHQLFRRLVQRDPAHELRPDLAVVVADGPGHWRIDLLPVDAGGGHLTADDVRRSWLRILRHGPDEHAALLQFVDGARLVREHRAARIGDAPARLRRAPFLRAEGATDDNLFGLIPASTRVELVESNLCTPRGNNPQMLREAPDLAAPVVTSLFPDDEALVLTERIGAADVTPPELWRQVRPLGRASTGWVRARDVTSVFTSPRQMVIDAGAQDGVPLFADKAATVARRDPLLDGDVVELLAQHEDVAEVRHHRTERSGYVTLDVIDDTSADRVWYHIRARLDDRGEMAGWVPARDLVPDDARFGVTVRGPRRLDVTLSRPDVAQDVLTHTALSIVPAATLDDEGRAAFVPGGGGLSTGRYAMESTLSFDGIRLQPTTRGPPVDVSTLRDPATIFRAFLAGRISVAWGTEFPDVMLAPLSARPDVVVGEVVGAVSLRSDVLSPAALQQWNCTVSWPEAAGRLFHHTATARPRDCAAPAADLVVDNPVVCFTSGRAALAAFVGQSIASRTRTLVRYRRHAGRSRGCTVVVDQDDRPDPDAALDILSLTLVGPEVRGVPRDPTAPFALHPLALVEGPL